MTITGQRGNAVLIGEDDWRAIQESLFLAGVPGFTESTRQARTEGIGAGSETATRNWSAISRAVVRDGSTFSTTWSTRSSPRNMSCTCCACGPTTSDPRSA